MSAITTIDDVCEQIVDCEHKTAPIDPDGEYFAVGTPAMRGNRINYEESRRISKETFVKWTRRLVPTPGDLLFAREAPVGPVVRIPDSGNVAPGQRTMLLRPDPQQIDSHFFYYLLTSPQQQDLLLSKASGSTVAHLNVADVRAFRLPELPELAQQRAIAEVLGALDDKIAANTNLAETSAQLAQASFARSIQIDSQELLLSEITDVISRGITPKYSDNPNAMIVLNQKCIRGLRVDLGPSRRTDTAKVRQDKVLIPDDVLVNSTGQGTLGRVARWTLTEEATVDSHITILRFDSTKVDPVCAGFSVLRMQDTIEAMGEGSTGQTELSRSELGKLPIRLPKNEAQQALGNQLSALAAMENAYLAENLSLASTRDALLPRLMSGRLRVHVAEAAVESIV